MILGGGNVYTMLDKISERLDTLAKVRENYYYSYDTNKGTFYQTCETGANFLDSTVGQVAAVSIQGLWRFVTFDNHGYLVSGLGELALSVRNALESAESYVFGEGMDRLKRATMQTELTKLQGKVELAAAGVLKLLKIYEGQKDKEDKIRPYQSVYSEDLPLRIKTIYEKIEEVNTNETAHIKQRYLSEELDRQLSTEEENRMMLAVQMGSQIFKAKQNRLNRSISIRKRKPDPRTGLSEYWIGKLKEYLALNRETLPKQLKIHADHDPLNPFLYLRPNDTGFMWPIQYFSDKVVIHLSSSTSKSRKGLNLKGGTFKKVHKSVAFRNGKVGKVLVNAVSVVQDPHEYDVEMNRHLLHVANQERHFLEKYNQKKNRGIVRVKNISRYPAKRASREKQAILMKDYNMGDLLPYINSKEFQLTKDQKNEIFLDVLYGLRHIHSDGAVHKDIKPDNIVLENDSKLARKKGICAAICDFGFCSYLFESVDSIAGTVNYLSPEIIESLFQESKKESVGTETDIWSTGTTFWVLYTGERTPAMEYILQRKIEQQKRKNLTQLNNVLQRISEDTDAIADSEKRNVHLLIKELLRIMKKEKNVEEIEKNSVRLLSQELLEIVKNEKTIEGAEKTTVRLLMKEILHTMKVDTERGEVGKGNVQLLSRELLQLMKNEKAIEEPKKGTVQHLIWRMLRPKPKDRVTAAEAIDILLEIMGRCE